MRKLYDPYAKFAKNRLSSGSKVYYLENDLPWVTLLFCIHAGAINDPIGKEGLAHFVEHLLGHNIPVPMSLTKDQFRELAEKEGGDINFGRTSYFSTAYSFKLPLQKRLIKKVINVFGGMILEANIANQIEEQRQIITLEFLESYGTEIGMEVAELWQNNLYADYWLKRFYSPFGRKETIESIGKDDLQLFYAKHYRPANISIIGAGGLAFDQLIRYLEKSLFGKSKAGQMNQLLKPTIEPPLPAENFHVIKASRFSKAKWHKGVYESRALLPGSLNQNVMALLYHMIYEKLHQNLRVKSGWVYSVSPGWFFLQDVYEFKIEANVSVDSLKDHQIHALINSSLEEVLDPVFFEYQKKKLIGSCYLADQPVGNIVDSVWHDLEQRQKIITRGKSVAELRKINLADIKTALRFLRSERRMTILLTP